MVLDSWWVTIGQLCSLLATNRLIYLCALLRSLNVQVLINFLAGLHLVNLRYSTAAVPKSENNNYHLKITVLV